MPAKIVKRRKSPSTSGKGRVSILGRGGVRGAAALPLIEQIRAGLPFAAIDSVRSALNMPAETLAAAAQIPPRTLSRRKASGRLSPAESERLVRIAALFEQTLGLFEGNADAARAWLLRPQPALAGSTPLDFARTELGAREVEDLIGRLEHGILP